MDDNLIKAIREQRLYDYVANFYTLMDKYDLATLCKELIYVATCRLSEEDQEMFYDVLANNLSEE